MLLLNNPATADASRCGSKAATLSALCATFPIPRGFVVLPDDMLDQSILAAFSQLDLRAVAVRSSAMNEDGTEAAWAGQLQTLLNIDEAALINAIIACRGSAEAPHAKAYASAHGAEPGRVAVIIQDMVASKKSGVAFTRHPVNGNPRVVVEAVNGLGEGLVSGKTTPDTYVEGEIPHLASDAQVLNDDELESVISLAKQVRDALGYDVDIEWAFDDAQLWLLQARPITTV